MYVEVKTKEQQKAFQRTWEFFCQKYAWHNDPYAENGIRYLLLAPDCSRNSLEHVVGTIEFIPYDPRNRNSTVEGRCRFSQYNDIAQHQDRTWEIDKLCIAEEYQRKGFFKQFMPIFHDHAKQYKPKYYLSFMDKKLFRMLRISFGLAMEQRGTEQIGPANSFVPAVIDIERLLQNRAHVKQLLRSSKLTLWKRMKHRWKMQQHSVRSIFFRHKFLIKNKGVEKR